MNIYKYFQENRLKPTPALVEDYIEEHGGAVINTFRDSIFTDDTTVTMDKEETILLETPLILGSFEFAAKAEINPNFIVSITYFKPKSKIVLS
jgi:hypothetical protein